MNEWKCVICLTENDSKKEICSKCGNKKSVSFNFHPVIIEEEEAKNPQQETILIADDGDDEPGTTAKPEETHRHKRRSMTARSTTTYERRTELEECPWCGQFGIIVLNRINCEGWSEENVAEFCENCSTNKSTRSILQWVSQRVSPSDPLYDRILSEVISNTKLSQQLHFEEVLDFIAEAQKQIKKKMNELHSDICPFSQIE